jgi:uncharacterized membrane protein YeaQ/YmgE (transglycosylase-associated protein family)
MLNSESKNILRWIALPFAAFIGAFLGSVLLALFQWFSIKMWAQVSEDGWYAKYVMPFLSSVFFGYFYSIISLEVAPRSKIIATTVIVTLFGVFSVFSLFLAWNMQSTHGFGYFIEVLFGSIGAMIAAIATLVNHKENNN